MLKHIGKGSEVSHRVALKLLCDLEQVQLRFPAVPMHARERAWHPAFSAPALPPYKDLL